MDFARLYMVGYAIERALYHARGQAIMNRQYAMVGEETHVLTQGDSIQPAVTHVNSTSDGLYSTRFEESPDNLLGGAILPYSGSGPTLLGNHKEALADEEKLKELIASSNGPFVFNNIYWPEELLEELF